MKIYYFTIITLKAQISKERSKERSENIPMS